MILEIAEIEVTPGEEGQVEAKVAAARRAFARAEGCRSLTLGRSFENRTHYLPLVEWERLDDHVVHFRNSENFAQWRWLAGPHFAAPPRVEHCKTGRGAGPAADAGCGGEASALCSAASGRPPRWRHWGVAKW